MFRQQRLLAATKPQHVCCVPEADGAFFGLGVDENLSGDPALLKELEFLVKITLVSSATAEWDTGGERGQSSESASVLRAEVRFVFVFPCQHCGFHNS